MNVYGDFLKIPQTSGLEQRVQLDDNAFYDESKQQRIVSKLPVAIREAGVVFEKTRSAIREKLEKLTSFLLTDKARNSKFLDRIDVK